MISAILLAAGQSKRMNGENKLTKEIGTIPLIKHSVKNILESNVDELIVVLGYQKEILENLIIKNKKTKIIYNKNFKTGMASSIKCGLNNISKKTEFFFICLSDMPEIRANIYNEIIKFKKSNEIIVPTYNGRQGNPVLFSSSMISKIMTIKGDIGAKKIIQENKDKILNLEINEEGIIKDYNTQENFSN